MVSDDNGTAINPAGDLGRWSIPFLGRDTQLRALCDFLNFDEVEPCTSRFVVRGDSGTGKSYLIKEALYQALEQHAGKCLCLYVDLSNDEFQSSRLLSSLLNLSLVPTGPQRSYPMAVPDGLTVSDYQQKVLKRRAVGWSLLKGFSQAAASVVGMGDALSTALRNADVEAISMDEVLYQYLKWVSTQVLIVIAIDNYQFLNHDVRLSLEAMLLRLTGGVRLLVVDRTLSGQSEITPPLQQLGTKDQSLELGRFSLEETQEIIRTTISANERTVANLSADVFAKTAGLPKDVEFCLRQYRLARDGRAEKFDVVGLLATIDKLPLMHRQFLLVASMLDGGVKEALARRVIRRMSAAINDAELDRTLAELISLDYLKVNSESGDRLRAGHERVVQAMQELSTDTFYDEVRRALVEEFQAVLKGKDSAESEAYLLHCFVGLQSASELRGSLHFISRLVRAQHRQEQFAYLVNLAEEARDIVGLLPEDVVTLLLDAAQKSSSFDRGLQLITFLDEAGAAGHARRQLYRYKFLTQLYQYEEASKVAGALQEDEWSALYKVNALMALEKNDAAREIADPYILDGSDTTEPIAVLLRNTVTLFRPEAALAHLERSASYFRSTESEFRLATVETNAALVHLCVGNLGDASRALENATERMLRVGSREVFQAQFNSAVRQALSSQYGLAKESLRLARSSVPSALLLDDTKIAMAAIVVGAVSGELSSQYAADQLRGLLSRIRGIDMPYLRRTIEYNISVLGHSDQHKDQSMTNRLAGPERVSLYIPIRPKGREPLVLNPSIHWRY